MGDLRPAEESGVATRRLAIGAIERILVSGAYANLLVPSLLADSGLETRDRGFVTELVYGTTRMRRAVDFLIDRFIDRPDVEPRVRAALQIGAYQLAFLETPPHAAVDATVAATPKRARGFVNAILRKVSSAGNASTTEWPNDAIRLSYPNWIVEQFERELGERTPDILESMNQAAVVHTRADGYRQDQASQAVAELIDTADGQLVIDTCSAPGGKATAIASRGPVVIGLDLHEHRAGLVAQAAGATESPVHAVVADATRPPVRAGSADAVLIDAPCSGLGSLRRRPDARWRIQPDNIEVLAQLQFDLVRAAASLVRPGGQVVFSVCTLSDAESIGVDSLIASTLPELVPDAPDEPWEPFGRGGRLLPDVFPGDGMAAFRYRRR